MIYLIRHGETEFNKQKRFQGRNDSSLTGLGREQATSVGRKIERHLKESSFVLHVSPLGRTRQTAEIIAAQFTCPKPLFDWRISEIDIGDWGGLTATEIEADCSDAFEGPSKYDWGFRAPNGESKDAFFKRLNDWLTQCRNDGKIHVAVSHGWAGLALRSLYLEATMETVGKVVPPQDAVFLLNDGQVQQL